MSSGAESETPAIIRQFVKQMYHRFGVRMCIFSAHMDPKKSLIISRLVPNQNK